MIALAHGDGTLWPNHALMALSFSLRSRGEETRVIRHGDRRDLWTNPTRIYGSSVFGHSRGVRRWLENEWGSIAWGGTGVWERNSLGVVTSTGPDLQSVDAPQDGPLDYSIYPDFDASIGFTARGCRLSCGFCVVPKKEGKPRPVHSVTSIWRGYGYAKKLLLLDNDFFGQPREDWIGRLREIRDGGFRVCFAQGINVRLVDDEGARELSTVLYSDTRFRRRRLYSAWDNLGDEQVVRDGLSLLNAAGIAYRTQMVYMLVGFNPRETWEQILYRFDVLVGLGCLPYPMVFDRERQNTCNECRDQSERKTRCSECNGHWSQDVRSHVKKLGAFARWVSTGLYRAVPWSAYDVKIKTKNTKGSA